MKAEGGPKDGEPQNQSFQSHIEVLGEPVYMVCLTLQGRGQIPKPLNCPKREVRVLEFHTRQVSQSLTPITFLHLGGQGEKSSIIISHVQDPSQLCVRWHIFLFFPAC